jgi:trehalose-phosphatase
VSLTQLEYKVLSLSVHYRRVHDEPTARQVRDIVERTCAPYNGLYLWHGKRVVEVRPDVEWDKGEALRMLRELTTAQTPGAPTLFVGDDRTDEDGFDDVGETGYGIIVADPVPPDTLARAFLRSVDEVAEFLRGLDAD